MSNVATYPTSIIYKILLLLLSPVALGYLVYRAMKDGGWIYFIKSVERPAYTTLLRDGSFEIRSYPSMIVAEIAKTGERRSAVGQGLDPWPTTYSQKNAMAKKSP